jgi:HNH endonuclease
MNIEWIGNRCILCLKTKPLSIEHIIPESIGGVLTSSILCQDCNSHLGSEIEACIRSDPTIRLAANYLSEVNSSLALKLEKGQPFIIHGGTGKEPAYLENGEVRIHPRRADDGSLIQPTDTTRNTVSKILQKQGVSSLDISQALYKLENSEPNSKVEIYPGLDVISWTPEKAEPDLSKSELANPLIPLKIAFEFLALHLGEAIYDEALQFQELRAAMLECNTSAACFKVERLLASSYKPFHGICHEGNAPYTTVQVRLFGKLAFRVHFLRLAANGPRFVYTHDLSLGKEYISEPTTNAV